MPAYVASWVAGALKAWGASSAVVNIAYGVTYVASTAALAYGVQALSRTGGRGAAGGYLQTGISSAPPRAVIVGTHLTGGDRIGMYVTGAGNRRLIEVIALADHRCDACLEYYADGVLQLTDLQHGVRTPVPAYRSTPDRVWVTWYDGRHDQAHDSNLAGYALDQQPDWTANHRGRGVSYAIVEMDQDSDTVLSPIKSQFLIRGGRWYDRRKDSTAGGSGAHRWANPDTWEFTSNPIVFADHYQQGVVPYPNAPMLAFGMKVPIWQLPYAQFKAEADIAEEQVLTRGDVYQNRYAMNCIIPLTLTHREIMEMCAQAIAGRIVDLGGRLRFLSPQARSAVMTLYDEDVVRGTQSLYSDKLSISDLKNTFRGRFPSPAQRYQLVDYPELKDAAWIAQDGGDELVDPVDINVDTDLDRVQRLVRLHAQNARRQATLIESYGPFALEIEEGDWFMREGADFPGGKMFEAVRVDLTVSLTGGMYVTIQARECDPADVAWSRDQASDLSVSPSVNQETAFAALAAPTLTVAATYLEGGGAKLPAINITANNATDVRVTQVAIEAQRMSGDPLAPTGPIVSFSADAGPSRSNTWVVDQGILPATVYRVRARYHGVVAPSPWSTAQVLTSGASFSVSEAVSVAAGIGANAVMDSGFRWRSAFWSNLYKSFSDNSTIEAVAIEGGIRVYRRSVVGAPPTNGQFNLGLGHGAWSLPVSALQRVEASCYFGAAKLNKFEVAVNWHDSSGAYLSTSVVESVTSFTGGAFVDGLSAVQRAGGIATAPTGAAFAVFGCAAYAAGGILNAFPSAAIGLPLIRIANTGQTGLTAWSPGLEAQLGADVTLDNVAAAVLGQAAAATDHTIQTGATRNNLTYGATAPTSPENGDMWGDTSVTPVVWRVRSGGAWQVAAANGGTFGATLYKSGSTVATLSEFQTSLGVAQAVLHQAAAATDPTIQSGATRNALSYGATAPTSPANGDLWGDTSTTPTTWRVRIAGAWEVAASNGGVFGANLFEPSGVLATLANFKTSEGVAQSILGQQWGATAAEALIRNSLIAGDSNLCPDPEFRWPAVIWTDLYAAGGTWTTVGFVSDGRRFYQRSATAPAGALQVNLGVGAALGLAVTPTQRVEFSAYVGFAGMASCKLYLNWFNASGAYLSSTEIAAPAAFSRGGDFATVPTGAVTVTPALVGVTAGGVDAYLHLSEPLLRIARADQTALTPYNSGPRSQPFADVTIQNIAASIQGQGTQATANHHRGTSYPGTPTEGSTWSDTATSQLKMYVGGSWVVVADVGGGFSASASPAEVTGSRSGAGSVTTGAVTITAIGGSGYSYAWSHVSGDTFTVGSPTSATTTFTTTVTAGQNKSGVYRCTTRDAAARIALNDVSVSATSLS